MSPLDRWRPLVCAHGWPSARPRAAQMPHDARLSEQWAVAPRSPCSTSPPAWEISRGAGVVGRRDRLRRAGSTTSTSRPTSGSTSTRCPATGVDDDGNGYVDDVHGVDFTTIARGSQDLHDG